MNLEKKSVVQSFRLSVNDIMKIENGETVFITIEKERYKIRKVVKEE